MTIPLEDTYTDIIGKAQRGLKLENGELEQRAGISEKQWATFKSGTFDANVADKVSPVLGLDAKRLSVLAAGGWYPAPVTVPGLECFNTPYHDMTVNAYLIWDPETRQAAAFDTGGDCSGMLALAAARDLVISQIFITHTHEDHIADLVRLKAETGAVVHVNELEGKVKAGSFREGKQFGLGSLRIDTLLTSGHAPGGTTFVITGLSRPLAVVGDAIFAGSMGGGMVSYVDALRTNQGKILTLSPETVLCPGHGPLTTVEEERVHNPFFPLLKQRQG